MSNRSSRQKSVYTWAKAAFGSKHVDSVEQRGLRFAEEAIELAQGAGCDPATLHQLIDYVYSRPVGDIRSEIGGAGITLLCLAEACHVDADTAEEEELSRVLSLPLDHFKKRNEVKNKAGFNVVKDV